MGAYPFERHAAARPVVAIDLHPAAPGGVNGGIKIVVDELVRELPLVAPDLEFIFLTKSEADLRLEDFDEHHAPHAIRKFQHSEHLQQTRVIASRFMSAGRQAAARLLPRRCYWGFVSKAKEYRHRGLLRHFLDVRPDLVFCPFASQFFAGRGVPSISLIADLQHQFFPDFFSRPERLSREREFQRACRTADRLIAISEWTRSTILDAVPDLSPEKVEVIHIGLPTRPTLATHADKRVAGLGLESGNYLLYPANFWPHKNHSRAVAAFGMFLSQHPHSPLKLVFTGADTGGRATVARQIEEAGLTSRVLLAGYCDDDLLMTLLASCRGLFFPSLFEGYGIPPLEAMAAARPVLCSQIPSLLEVVGDSACTFDPRSVESIAGAIAELHRDGNQIGERVARGKVRADAIGGSRKMAEHYASTFRAVLGMHSRVVPLKSRAA